ncbi:CoA ester lyase [Natrinema thermotolerans]|uniref:CoA ester lyase n=1 Tax=Natrinema thermotolerans TaxID=121872 RepID=A0AAF0PGK8_9EURY|nr:CoA ester lyase [Natrinema thermotolerans]ELZ12965.1 Citryl-CoA lyase [Natrinema thermotolerans DSM 11552]QCC57988.1 CoA ester lyase [Natrinema thermotolerans]WMT09084.1 CoA ester lyase [Natrinema thermotolerans]
MVRRSVLFAPGDEPEIMRKAATSEADVVVFDLEDAVAPADKAAAREAVRDVLADGAAEPERCVRVNPVGTSAATDLEAILEGPRPDSVMLPKTESAADVRTVERLFDEYDADLPVLSLIESAAGVLRADEIATAAATDALLFGAEDLAADIGATRTSEGTEVLYARERTVLAASAAGVDAIDTVYTDFTDTDGLRDETAFAARLGYDGKIAIHPAQVPVINDAFTPSDDDVEWAERVLDARDRTDAGVFEVDGEMIDAPLIAQAERILERAEQVE